MVFAMLVGIKLLKDKREPLDRAAMVPASSGAAIFDPFRSPLRRKRLKLVL
jgi:hypothetical protein